MLRRGRVAAAVWEAGGRAPSTRHGGKFSPRRHRRPGEGGGPQGALAILRVVRVSRTKSSRTREFGRQLLARTTERRDLEYTFTVVDSDTVNAFAAPGGHIYITRGLLALVGDEAELASVLGHELGHITALHYARGRGQTILVQLGLLAADVLAQRAGAATVRSVLNDLGGTAGLAYLRSHSRENEYESDDLGIRYLARAGYDTQGAARNLAKLRAHARLKARLAGRSPDEIDRFDYTATHPAPVKRIRRAIDIAARTPVRKPMVARDVFLRKIDGCSTAAVPSRVSSAGGNSSIPGCGSASRCRIRTPSTIPRAS